MCIIHYSPMSRSLYSSYGLYHHLKRFLYNIKMNQYEMDLSVLSLHELKDIAKRFDIEYKNVSKEALAIALERKYYQLKKYVGYTYIRQLGFRGKDGRTFLARAEADGKEYAVKVFKESKSARRIAVEVELQNIAYSGGVSVKVIEANPKGKYVVMEKLDKTLFQIFRDQKGKLTNRQQKEIIKCFQELDKCGVFHADPNPCNFMIKEGEHKFYAIDFGFSKKITTTVVKKHGPNPNMKYMVTGIILKLNEIEENAHFDILQKYSII